MKAFWLAGIVLLGTAVRCDATDPSTYFGGTNHKAYLDWYTSLHDTPGTVYPASLYFSPTGTGVTEEDGMALHWNIVKNQENSRLSYLQVAIAVRAMNGWVGFGLADAGGMQGADVMLYESNNPATVRDAHILLERLPLTDDCQDWELVDTVVQEDGFLIVQARRLLDTLDTQDKAIINDKETILSATRIIGAWGNNTASASFHGPNRVRSAMRFHGLPTDGAAALDEYENFKEVMAVEAEGYFEINANNSIIPANVTTYYSFCISWKDILAQGVPDGVPLHVVGFEPRLDADSAAYWHHLTVSAIEGASDLTSCSDLRFEIMYGWASGAVPEAFPPNFGLLFGQNGFQGVSVVSILLLLRHPGQLLPLEVPCNDK